MGKQYTPSGKAFYFFSSLFIVVTLVASLAITEAAALIGLWLSRPYAGIVMMFLSCWLIYRMHIKVFKFTKNRNPAFARAIIIVLGLITAFFHLASVSSVSIVMGVSLKDVLLSLSPTIIRDVTIGAFYLFKWPLEVFRSFFGIGTAWIVYFFLTILLNIIIPLGAVRQTRQPFHELFSEWMYKEYASGKIELFDSTEKEEIVDSLKEQDISPILNRARVPSQVITDYSVITFYKIRKAHTGYVGIDNCYLESKSKNNTVSGKFSIEEFIVPIQIGTSLAEQLTEIMESSAITGIAPSELNSHKNSGQSLYRRLSGSSDFIPPVDSTKPELTPAADIPEPSELPKQKEPFRRIANEPYSPPPEEKEFSIYGFNQNDFSLDDPDSKEDKNILP